MKKRKGLIIWIIILLVIISAAVITRTTRKYVKIEGSIPYNQNSTYFPYQGGLIEITENKEIIYYDIAHNDNGDKIQMNKKIYLPFHFEKCISSEMFSTPENDIIYVHDMFHTAPDNLYYPLKLGNVKNVIDADCYLFDIPYTNDYFHTASAVTSDGQLYVMCDSGEADFGIEDKQLSSKLIPVPTMKNIVKARCGSNCVFALTADGEVFAAGNLADLKYEGFTKLEAPEKITDIIASEETLVALAVNGNVYEIGTSFFKCEHSEKKRGKVFNSFHKISKLRNIMSIANEDGLTAYAIDKSGKVFNWGSYMVGKSTELSTFFKHYYGFPKYEKIWADRYLYILFDNQITAYSLS